MAEAAEVDTAQALVNHYEKTATFAASSDIARSSTVGSMRVDVKQKNRGKISIAWRTFQRYAWDDPDKPKEEKLFLFKLDCFLLSATCLGYFCKNLAQGNISNAYVSGMREDLHMTGSALTYTSNVFTAGYVLGQIPAVILVTRIRPSLLVPTAEALWSVASFCCAAATTVPQLYGLRFLVGFFESFYFPVIVYLISSWYTKEERAKRVVLFYSTSTLASMFSGYLQAAAYKNLNGTLGHSGWQWLFIITGVISLGSSLLSYAFLPDWPETTRAFYLSSTEKAFARTRLVNYGYAPLGQSKWTRKKIFSIMKHWQFYVLPVGYLFVQSSLPSQQPVFNLWLKAEKYSVYDVNVLPTIAPGIAVIAQVVAGMLSDSPLLQGRRWEAITFLQAGTFFSVVVLAVWDVSHNLKFAAMCLTYMSAGVPGLYFAWFPELIPHDHEMRGFLVAFTNIFSYINQIWWSDAVWRTVHAPRFHSGFIGASIMGVCMVLTAVLMHLLEQRDRRTEKRDLDQSSENASEA